MASRITELRRGFVRNQTTVWLKAAISAFGLERANGWKDLNGDLTINAAIGVAIIRAELQRR